MWIRLIVPTYRKGRSVGWSIMLLVVRSGVALSLLCGTASAHVKWFAPYDVSQTPTPVNGVLSLHFVTALLAFTLMIAASFLLDHLLGRPPFRLPGWNRRRDWLVGSHEGAEERLLRAGVGAFFVADFAVGGTILTPELHTMAEWPAWAQLGIAASMLSAPTCAFGALGIVALYAYAVSTYGVFHLADYPLFLGVAAYLALTACASAPVRSYRMPVLLVTVCITLMWGATEKWAYPQWTFPLLDERSFLTFGLEQHDFMVVAGFVEFAFAFYIMTGLRLFRLAIVGLSSIFIAGIVAFGKLDAIGHLPFLVAFAVMFMHGPTPLQVRLHAWLGSAPRKARIAGTAFAVSVFLVCATYYGLQQAEFGQHTLVSASAARDANAAG